MNPFMKRSISILSPIIFIFFQIHQESWSQPVNNYIGDAVQPAPNTASIGKFGDIPVSHYTGVPNITIPIHQLVQGPLSHAVSISYHAGESG